MLPWMLAAAILGAGGPEGQMTVESSNLTATLGQANAWTTMTMECGGMPITINAGGQSAVINSEGTGWRGGAMGGNTEEVLSLSINGEPCATPPTEAITEDVTIVKTSKLASVEHTATLEFSGGVLRQTNEFNFAEEINLSAFYPFIYSFSPEFTDWLTIPAEGDPEPGEFTSDGAHRLNTEMQAFALYNDAAGRGVVVYLQKSPGGVVTLWDHANYRKFWVQPTKGPMKAGTEFDGTLILACFEGGDDWQAAALARAGELRAAYPPQKPEPRPNMLYDEGVPEVGFLTVETENWLAKFEAASAWTLDEIHWKDFMVAGPTGHYGTVLIPEDSNFIGTGHSEGGREVVHAVSLRVDGEDRPVEVATTATGDEIELFKKSTIHKFDAEHTVTLKPTEIVEHAVLRSTEAHNLKLMYLFMHCIEPATTRWVAELPDGTIEEGEFASDLNMELSKDARWVAEWFPEQNLSVLLYLTKLPEPENSSILLWDQERYHKFYTKHNGTLSVAEGDVLDYTLVFTVVEGETGDWAATKARAEELKAAYPPVDAAPEQE